MGVKCEVVWSWRDSEEGNFSRHGGAINLLRTHLEGKCKKGWRNRGRRLGENRLIRHSPVVSLDRCSISSCLGWWVKTAARNKRRNTWWLSLCTYSQMGHVPRDSNPDRDQRDRRVGIFLLPLDCEAKCNLCVVQIEGNGQERIERTDGKKKVGRHLGCKNNQRTCLTRASRAEIMHQHK